MNKTIAIVVLVVLLVLGLFALGQMDTVTPTVDRNQQVPSGQQAATGTPSLDLTYVTPVDWPPSPRLVAEAYSCTEAGSPTDRAGQTTKITIDGREWCRTVVTEGAAGSVYSQYAYATAEQNQTLAVTFSVRSVQCANFDATQRAACEAEQAAFDPDGVVKALY